MTDQNGYVRGIGTRLQMSAGFFLRTFVEIIELMAWSIAAGVVVHALLPSGTGVEESRGAFAAASTLGMLAGVLYAVYRLASKALFGRYAVVPIPNNPNVDWYLTLRSFGIAVAGVVFGVVFLIKGFGGDAQLRAGPIAPFMNGFMGSLSVGLIYLGAGKLLIRFAAR